MMDTMFETESDINITATKQTLEEYIKESNCEAFSLKLTPNEDDVHGYIHPDGINGNTINVLIRGNEIVVGEPYRAPINELPQHQEELAAR